MKKNLKTRILSLILAISMVIPNSSSLTTFAANENAAEDVATPGWEKIPEEDSPADASTEAEIADKEDLDEDEDIETYERSYMIFEAPDTEHITSDFPKKMEAEDNEGNIVSVPVTWQCDNYDPETVGAYHFSATIDEDFLTDYSEETSPDSSGAESKADNSSGSSDTEAEADDAEPVTIDEDSIQEITVTIEKNRIAKVKTAYDDLSYSIHKAPAADKIVSSLPDTIEVVYDDENKTTGTVDVEDWDYDYDDSAVGTYYFAPVIDDDRYELVEGTELPECSVSVEKVKILEIKSEFKALKYEIGDVPEDVTAKMPDTIKVVTSDGKEKITVDSWECEKFDAGKTGTYKFIPVISADYAFDDDVEIPSYEVNIVDPSETRLEAECDGATIIAEAKKGVIPNGTKLSVRKMTDEEIEAYEKAVAESGEISDEKELVFAFDVELVDKNGNKIEPDGEVSITIEAPEYENVTEPEIVHFKDGDEDAMEVLDTDIDDTSITVTTESLSPVMGYGIMAANDNDDSSPKNGNGLDPDDTVVTMRFKSGGKKVADNKYVWNAVDYSSGHQFVFRITYKGSVTGDIAASTVSVADNGTVTDITGGVQMRIPKSVLNDQNGNDADSYEMSIPSMSDLESMSDADKSASDGWAWVELGDEIVIYNFRTMQAFEGYIDLAYSTTKSTFNYHDYDPDDLEQFGSDDVKVTLTAPSIYDGADSKEGPTITRKSNPINLYINTQAYISSTYKKYPTHRTSWQDSWGTAPADADDYYWQIWEIESVIGGKTQSYDFTLFDDNIKATTGDGKSVDSVEVYAYRLSGSSWILNTDEVKKAGGVTIEGLTSDGRRYDSVLTRIKKSDVRVKSEDGKVVSASYTITNHVTATVHPADDVDSDTTKDSSRVFSWTLPTYDGDIPGSFRMDKYGDENWRGYWNVNAWHNERTYSSYDLDKLQEGKIDSLSYLNYAVWARGYAYPWTVGDPVSEEKPWTKFGQKSVTYEVSDSQFYPLNSDGSDGHYALAAKPDTGLTGTTEPGDIKVEPLTSDDYDISYINYNFFFQDAVRDNNGEIMLDEDTMDLDVRNLSTSSLSDDIVFEVYTKTGDADYVLAGTYQINNGTFAAAEGVDTVESMTSSRITFKKDENGKTNVDGFRIKTTNAFYYTNMCFYPYVTLYATDNVLNWTGTGKLNAEGSTAKDVVILKNLATFNVYDSENKKIADATWIRITGDRIKASEKSSGIGKTITSFSSNNVKKKSYNIQWMVGAYESYTEGDGQTKKFIEQDGGTFYDLLPEGGNLLDGSVMVAVPTFTSGSQDDFTYWANSTTGSQKYLDDNAFSYSTIEDYNGSGRTMLIVRIKDAASAYRVYYTTVHPWDSIKDVGTETRNPVAYETGNDEITDGYPDDPTEKSNAGSTNSSMSDKNKALYKDLDSSLTKTYNEEKKAYNADAYKFIYAETSHNIAALTAASSGLSKRVISGTASLWTYDTTVSPDEVYRYRLRYANTDMTLAKDLVLFDSLENFYLSNDSKDVGESRWKGTLTSIDLSQAKGLHSVDMDGNQTDVTANPLVYLSFTDAVDLDEDANHDLTNTKIWTRWDGTTPLSSYVNEDGSSKIKAIAVDMRKGLDGNGNEADFILPADASVTVALYMKAPHTIKDSETKEYPETYNNIYMDSSLVYTETSTKGNYDVQEFKIHHNYTTVRYHVTADFGVKKVSSKNENEAISGVTFTLRGMSDYGTEVNTSSVTDRDGLLSFKKVEKGTYILQETATTSDWLLDTTEHTVKVDGNGNVTIDSKDYTSTYDEKNAETVLKYITVTNDPRIHADIEFNKVDEVFTTTKLGGAEFTLIGTSDYGNDVYKVAVSEEIVKDENGIYQSGGGVAFKDVEKGIYTLKETKAPDGYSLNDTEYTVTIKEDGTYTITHKKLHPEIG